MIFGLTKKRHLREYTEGLERKYLSKQATLSIKSQGRQREEPACPLRTCFQHDRDRIIHSKAFRRLKHKTQVFISPEGDHYRTRMTHTLEVAQISRTISRALRLNEDLTEAIALAHDLGHTPFGHAGEDILNNLMPKGFLHVHQSLRVVDVLEQNGQGLNLTKEVRDGIVKHSKGLGEIIPEDTNKLPQTLEGQVVRIADLIAYINHDIDDASRAKLLNPQNIPKELRSLFGNTYSNRIHRMILDVVQHSLNSDKIQMSPEFKQGLSQLRDFLHKKVYQNPKIKEELNKAKKILQDLWNYFLEKREIFFEKYWPSSPEKKELNKAVCDFIAGMTDRYAIKLYEKIFVPKPWFVY